LSSRMDLVKPASDAICQRQLDPASPYGNRLTQNTNVAYKNHKVVWVYTQP